MTVDDVYLSFLPLAHILDRMIEEYFFHKGASVGYYHGVKLCLISSLLEEMEFFFLFSSYMVVLVGANFLRWQDLNALRDDLMELKPTFFAGVPRVFDRIHEGT